MISACLLPSLMRVPRGEGRGKREVAALASYLCLRCLCVVGCPPQQRQSKKPAMKKARRSRGRAQPEGFAVLLRVALLSSLPQRETFLQRLLLRLPPNPLCQPRLLRPQIPQPTPTPPQPLCLRPSCRPRRRLRTAAPCLPPQTREVSFENRNEASPSL